VAHGAAFATPPQSGLAWLCFLFPLTQAERLCAAILHLESFEEVDPQHPLGGPDGLKDVKYSKDGKTWIAAAYFPPKPPTFNEIQTKFDHDFCGVAANGAQAFAFFVNQPLTISERGELQSRTGGVPVEIYHLERIRSLLDAPKGCGMRNTDGVLEDSNDGIRAMGLLEHHEL